jgi:hypothetical protein
MALLGTLLTAPALLAAGFGPAFQLMPGSLAPGDHFGAAVAVGDGVVAVGAYLAAANGEPESGAVYLFQQDPAGGWSLPPLVLHGKAGEWFGFDVAIDGGKARGRLLVGAPRARASGQRTGAAYSFDLTAGAVGPLVILPIPGGKDGDEIGSAVAVAGDRWAVGARGDGQAGPRAGSVYLSRGGLIQKLLPDGAAAGGELGQSVSLDGDLLAVGAPLDAAGGPAAGAAYVFAPGPGGGWQGQRLPVTARPGAAFGYSVAAVAAGGGQVAVGAPLDDGRGPEAGAAYLFQRRDGTWQQPTQLDPGVAAGSQLGVAMTLDRGGPGEIVAGARRAFGDAGRAYRFSSAGSPLGVIPSPAPAGAQFGFGVAIHQGTLLAGAFMQDKGAGAAYLFAPAAPPAAQVVTVRLAQPSATFPESVGLARLGVVVTTSDQQPTRAPVTVKVAALSGTALAGSDFKLLDDQLTIPLGTIPSGQPQAEVRVAILRDPLLEADESFTVSLADPQGAVLGTPRTATVTLHDDDRAGLVVVLANPPRLATNDDGGGDHFDVALASQPSAPVAVAITGAGGRAAISPAAPLVFTPGSWNLTQRVTVTGVEAPPCSGTAPIPYAIALTTTSADPRYAALSPPAAPTVFVPVVERLRDRTSIAASLTVCPQLDGTVFYQLFLDNQGECALDELPGAELRDLLPWDDLALVAAAADSGTATVDLIANRLSWSGALPPGAQATIWIVATLQGTVPTGTPVANQGSLIYPSQPGGPLDSVVSTDDPTLPGPQDPTVFIARVTVCPDPLTFFP